MYYRAQVFSFVVFSVLFALGAGPSERSAPPKKLGECGQLYAPPFAYPTDDKRRPCGSASQRSYTPRHRGLGFEILDIESEACFVPDDAYRLLDELIDAVLQRLPSSTAPQDVPSRTSFVLDIGRITGDVLEAKGFELNIPTYTLSDALLERNTARRSPRHIFDCDTGAMIILTIAEKLSLPGFMVEMQLSKDSWHNYVRWQIDEKTSIDWDTNGRDQCVTPANMPPLQGQSMSRDQTISYVLRLRARLWSSRGEVLKAFDDYREAIRRFPEHPVANNGWAWLVATKNIPDRETYRAEALKAANQAVSIRRIPDYLDTLACVHAFAGNFELAAQYEEEALKGDGSNANFLRRVAQFRATPPKDCTGDE
jgi:tetratricopeptide (TPR) repeat protein